MSIWRDLATAARDTQRKLRDVEHLARGLEQLNYEIHGRPGDRIVGYIRPGLRATSETYYFVFCTDIPESLVIVPIQESKPASSDWLHYLWDHMGAHTAVERLRERRASHD